jgi:hypothetical protein
VITAYVVTGNWDLIITDDKMNRILGTNDKILSGFSQMPKRCGYVVRILSNSVDDIVYVRKLLVNMIGHAYSFGPVSHD